MHQFNAINPGPDDFCIPEKFVMMTGGEVPALCIAAAVDLQSYLQNQKDWNHNFGLGTEEKGAVVGKMFGVLVVKNRKDQLGYLAAFSGKLAGTNQHSRFVPPVFDLLEEGNFFNVGMQELNHINERISLLQGMNDASADQQIKQLKLQRKEHSFALQQQIFEQYSFVNKSGEEKGIHELFAAPDYKRPPAGAGECAGPKLLQYAFKHQMLPIALAEFWWGQSPKSATWKHGVYYPCCKEKCAPILAFMLDGIDD